MASSPESITSSMAQGKTSEIKNPFKITKLMPLEETFPEDIANQTTIPIRSIHNFHNETLFTEKFNNKNFYESRPAIIRNAVEKSYQLAHNTAPNYIATGRDSYFFGKESLSTDQIVSFMAKTTNEPLQLLDIGTGNGKLLTKEYSNAIVAHGLSAYDYSQRNPEVKKIDYRVGNAENLLQIKDPITGKNMYKPNSMDIIVSAETMKHLTDPLGTYRSARVRNIFRNSL